MLRRSALAQAALAAAVVLSAAAVPARSSAADYTLDPAHTQAEFVVTHLAISKVRGQIPLASGTLSAGANDLPTAISATLSAKDINTQSTDRDRDLRGADWLETDKYPTMTFVAKQVSGTPQAFTVAGDLTLHGVTKPVTLTGQLVGRMTDARGRNHVGYTATATIDRRQWNLNWGRTTPGGALVAANDVTINLNVEAVAK